MYLSRRNLPSLLVLTLLTGCGAPTSESNDATDAGDREAAPRDGAGNGREASPQGGDHADGGTTAPGESTSEGGPADASRVPPRDAGKTSTVNSIAALNAAIRGAAPGDTLVLADGTYSDGSIDVRTGGVVVRAATPGGVFLTGASNVVVAADHTTLSGFQFTRGNIGQGKVIDIQGSHNRVEQVNIDAYGAKTWIHVAAGTQFNSIEYCNIRAKPTTPSLIGAIIQISTSPAVIGYHSIRRCSFREIDGPGGDYGNEPIRIGLSTEKNNVARTVVEDCYFGDVGGGDNETISVKSSENVCRRNTFDRNPKGMLVFRHGNRNVAYGNFFINDAGGIRIKEGNHHSVYNNYFATGAASAVVLTYVPEAPLDAISFIHNTFVEMGDIALGGRGPTNVVFANNLFKRGSGAILSGASGGERWAGNLYAGNLGVGIPSGVRAADPQLARNADGYFGLSAASPAIDAASDAYPNIAEIPGVGNDSTLALDVGGQARPGNRTQKDVGCDEFGTGGAPHRPLTLRDVGPSYLGGPAAPTR